MTDNVIAAKWNHRRNTKAKAVCGQSLAMELYVRSGPFSE